MRLEIDLSALLAAVEQMGAPLREFRIETMPTSALDEIDIKLEQGFEVAIDEVVVKHGLLSYEGRHVLLYIEDHGFKAPEALDGDPGKQNKYHVSNCRTLVSMRQRGRFDRYVVTNDVSGTFHIYGKNYQTGQDLEGDVELPVCKNCLSELNYKGYRKGNKSQIFRAFELAEFFSVYSSVFPHMPRQYRKTNVGYTVEWKVASERFREQRDYACEQCGVGLRSHPALLHVHHINGVKHDNRLQNLRAVCIDCHRKQDFHQHMYVSHDDMRTINRLRREQRGGKIGGDWEEVFELADPAVHGILHEERRNRRPPPEVGFEVKQGLEVAIELELAWPRAHRGITLLEKSAIPRIPGWRIQTLGEALA